MEAGEAARKREIFMSHGADAGNFNGALGGKSARG
jgi:hypothetical protein